MAKEKESTPTITTWIPAPHDHEVVEVSPIVEDSVSE
jgi:hypothetical protein